MNHPGKITTLLFLLFVTLAVALIPTLMYPDEVNPVGYVCPPCGCSQHGKVWELPGSCPACGMPLIAQDYPKVQVVEWLFTSEDSVRVFHQKLLYPAFFLALFVGLLTLFQNRKKTLALYFLLFYLGHASYAVKNQLSGTSYSMHAPLSWVFFPITLLLITGPSLYLYFRQYLSGAIPWERRNFWHFLPALLSIVLQAIFFFGPESWRDFARYNNYDHYPGLAEQLVFVVSGIYYWRLTAQLLTSGEKVDGTRRRWLRSLLIFQMLFVALWGLMITVNFIFYSLMSTSLDFHIIWLSVALFSLWGSYWILFKREVVFPNESKKEIRLASAEVEALKERLETVMKEQKPYLQSNLTLQGLAQVLGIKEKELSELLNAGFSSNFYNYINEYRIEEVKKLLLDPEKQHLSNYGIAQEAGFSSKSSFFGLFKKHLGMTPGAYKKQFQGES